MKKIFLVLILSLLPSFAFADIAGPVLTKSQACQEQDGESMNRLQIFLNGKKSDTLYFYKKENVLYYVVPQFPYQRKKSYNTITYYYNALFLYSYDCNQKVAKLVTSTNLKKLVRYIAPGASPDDKVIADPDFVEQMNYGQVTSVTSSGITLLLSLTQQSDQSALWIPLK